MAAPRSRGARGRVWFPAAERPPWHRRRRRMRLLITADLHFNHRKSRALAEDLVAQMNRAGGDGVLLVGDTAAPAGDELERCLSLFEFRDKPRLFVPGNHEL